MDKLLGLAFGTPWWLVLALAVYGFCFATYHDLYAHEPSRERWIDNLAQNTWSNGYRDLLGRMLDWVDARLTPEISDQDWKPDEARAAWSHGLLNLSLLLAIAYPILSVIVYWAVSDQDGRIGTLVLIEGDAAAWQRAAALGLFATSIGSVIIARRAKGRMRLVYALVAYGAAIAFAIALMSAGAGTLAYAGALTLVGALAYAGERTFVSAYPFAFAIVIVIVIAFVGAGAGAGAIAIAIAFVIAGPGAQNWAGRRTGQRALTLALFVLLVLAALAVALRVGETTRPEANSVILFLGILPVLNALADYASTGLTRWRLRKGLAGRMWREMLIDLGGAALAFFLLGAFTILAIDHLRWSDGSALFDLAEFFTDIRANPGHYWWLYFTLFSTLIPTVLHAAVAVFGTGIHLWPGLRGYIVEGLDVGGRGDAVKGRWAVRALCLSMTVSVVAPVFVLGHIVVYRGIVGGWVLGLFEWFAGWVGAI